MKGAIQVNQYSDRAGGSIINSLINIFLKYVRETIILLHCDSILLMMEGTAVPDVVVLTL